MDEVWTTIEAEFSDLEDVANITRVSLRMLVAIVLGAALGYNREKYGTAAGLRTHMLVALGAALFVLVPQQAGMVIGDMSRVIQGVVAGIGFLGAGAILKIDEKERIRGVTTAASIWATAAIGIAAGLGREALALLATVFAFVILSLISKLEKTNTSGEKAPPEPK